MGIDAKVLGGSDVVAYVDGRTVNHTFLLVFHGVHLGMAVTKVERLLAVGRLKTERVGKCVPAPVAHGGKGNTVLVVVSIGLHARDVDGCGKVTITNG